MAPAYGEDDYQASLKYDLPMIQALDARGQFTDAVPPYAGKFFKAADPEITADLKSRGLLFKKETYTHSYPHCWRCDTPLLYYARKSWYIRTTAYAKDMIAYNKQIHWYPPETGEGRFGNWLEENKDWAHLARPVLGNAAADLGLPKHARRNGPSAASTNCGKKARSCPNRSIFTSRTSTTSTLKCSCGGEMRRIPELVDVWFDSGSMPFAQWHYPFENQETFKHSFPADFICRRRRSDARLVLHAALDQLVPFQAAVFQERHLQRSGSGQERPEDVEDARQHRRSISGDRPIRRRQRAMVPDCIAARRGNRRLSTSTPIAEVQRKFFGTLLNTYAFFALYANIDGFKHAEPDVPVSERPDIDQLDSLAAQHHRRRITSKPWMATIRRAPHVCVSNFTIEQLSNWYVRRNRRRFWKSEPGPDKTAAYQTLFECLVAITKMTAPLAPFLADEIYRALMAETRREPFESVHIAPMVERRKELIDPELERRMDVAQRVVGLVRSMRAKTNLKTRQPLSRIAVPASPETRRLIEQMNDVILEEINVKAIEFIDESSPIVRKTATANFKIIGPKFGKQVNAVAKRIKEMSSAEVDRTGSEPERSRRKSMAVRSPSPAKT